MFQRLFGKLVSGQVISFCVVSSGNTMRVRGEFVELSSSLVRFSWHSASCPHCPLHLLTIPFSALFN
jgi:hypothetical protein